jgi:transposase
MAANRKPRKKTGRRPKLKSQQVEVLVGLIRENPTLSMDDLTWHFRKRTGVSISPPTANKYLLEAGFTRTRNRRTGSKTTPSPKPPVEPIRPSEPGQNRYGYTDAHRDAGGEGRYPCGLTDAEWERVRHLFDPPGRTGRPAKYPRRQMLDACVYVLRSGCSWRMLPKDFPPWLAVYRTFRRWLARDLFEQMYDELRAVWRSHERRDPNPTAAILDSQSVKTSPQGGEKGYDAAKKVKGRKRHLVTDTLGLLVAVLVTTANVHDRDAALPAMELALAKVSGITKLYVDGGYSGSRVRELRNRFNLDVETVRHPSNRNVGIWHQGQLPLFAQETGFVKLPKRWVIERTNAFNDRPRRMNKDHDRSIPVSTGWIWLAEGRRLLRQITTSMTA